MEMVLDNYVNIKLLQKRAVRKIWMAIELFTQKIGFVNKLGLVTSFPS